ncbi:MAG: L,D-transpeptidase family protein [Candidatus Kerfeldbacteria bacterium]|nr:L,D-transpeptidase family protein [Candidatus Kerfeldbacteria bacterium]
MKNEFVYSVRAISFFFIIGSALYAHSAAAALTRNTEIQRYSVSEQGTRVAYDQSIFPFGKAATQGEAVALGDLNGDGTDEIIVSRANGEQPSIQVFSPNGILTAQFLAFPENITIELHLATGDLNNDGRDEIIVGAGEKGGPAIRVFNGKGKQVLTPGFFAFDQQARGGVFVAAGNVDGKPGDEIIAGSGIGQTPLVRVFSGTGTSLNMEFVPFVPTDTHGVTVAAANVDGGKRDELIMSSYTHGGIVKIYRTNKKRTLLADVKPYGNFYGGLNVARLGDVNGDGKEELLVSPRSMLNGAVKLLTGLGQEFNTVQVYEDTFTGGVSVAGGNLDSDSQPEFVALPQQGKDWGPRPDLTKYIEVDLSEQVLRAYNNGHKDLEFLVSTGRPGFPTPQGTMPITAKLPLHDYKWNWDPGNPDSPDNYDVKDVKYNLRFQPHYYIHAVTWHNLFGHAVSHGCVNANVPNAKLIFDWAEVGDLVWIHP